MAGAALMDHWQRRVPNDWWIRWGLAIGFLLLVEVVLLEADFALILGTLGILAWCSASVIGTPSVNDIQNGSKIDLFVAIWYLLGIVGAGMSVYLHGANALWSLNLAVDAPMFHLTDLAAIEIAEKRGRLCCTSLDSSSESDSSKLLGVHDYCMAEQMRKRWLSLHLPSHGG